MKLMSPRSDIPELRQLVERELAHEDARPESAVPRRAALGRPRRPVGHRPELVDLERLSLVARPNWRKNTGCPSSGGRCRQRARTGDSTTAGIVAPDDVDRRLSTPESWRSRAEVAERGDRRPGIVAREHGPRLAPTQVAGRELAAPAAPGVLPSATRPRRLWRGRSRSAGRGRSAAARPPCRSGRRRRSAAGRGSDSRPARPRPGACVFTSRSRNSRPAGPARTRRGRCPCSPPSSSSRSPRSSTRGS